MVFHLLKNFPQFLVIHTVKGFGIFNKAEVDIFSETLLLFPWSRGVLAIWPLVPLPFLKPAWTSGSSWFMYCWSLAWRILRITMLVCEMSAIVHKYPFFLFIYIFCYFYPLNYGWFKILCQFHVYSFMLFPIICY